MLGFFRGEYAILEVGTAIIVIFIIIFVLSVISLHRICSITCPATEGAMFLNFCQRV